MGYLIATVIGIVVVWLILKGAYALIKKIFIALWEFLKILFSLLGTVLKFLWDNWQLPIGFLCGWFYDDIIRSIIGFHIDNKIVAVVVMILFCYLVSVIFRGLVYFYASCNEKSLERYLKNKCSKLGYVSVNQLCEYVKKYETKRFNREFRKIVENFLNKTTIKHYNINDSRNWLNLYNYLENKTSNGVSVSSTDLFRDCVSDFMWTSKVRKEEILYILLSESKLPFFANYDIQASIIYGQKVYMISNLSFVEECGGDWG